MKAASLLASALQTGGGGGGGPHTAASCLGMLLALIGLPLASFAALRLRSRGKRGGSGKPEFTSLRSTGKTIVNPPPDEDDDGGAN